MAQTFISIVIPAFNEELRISKTLETVVGYISAQPYSWEILVVDDGSQDNTAALVESLAVKIEGVKLLRFPHGGKGWAVRGGMMHASGEYRFLADADLSMSIEQLEKFLPSAIGECDVAIGSREILGANRFREPFVRHIMGRVFNFMVRLFAVRGISDTQCGFKCFKAEAAERLFALQRSLGFGFDVEILFLAQKLKMEIREVPVDWYYSKGSKVNPIRDSFLMMTDLLFVLWNFATGKYGRLNSM